MLRYIFVSSGLVKRYMLMRKIRPAFVGICGSGMFDTFVRFG